jgi:dipeptidyl-peptidase-4
MAALARSGVVSIVLAVAVLACAPADNGAPPPRAPTPPAPSAPPGGRATVLGPEASPITFERMARFPEPGWNVPRAAAFSPDGAVVTFLASETGGDEMALFAFDLATSKTSVIARARDLLKQDKPMSREEELRRERQRQRAKGISDYRWAKKTNRMVIPLGGDLFLRDEKGAVTRLTDTKEAELDPKLCATGERLAFVRGSELYAIEIATKKETELTTGGKEGLTHGVSDYNGQEEFDESSGFFWSPTCDKLVYLEVDERKVGTVPVVGYRGGKPDTMDQRYPEAGAVNPIVRAGILDVRARRTSWITDVGAGYIARFAWTPDGKAVIYQRMTRDQKKVSVMRADASTGKSSELWSASDPAWVDFIDARVLEKTPRIVAIEDRAGHQHLTVHDAATGKRAGEDLTSGTWDVSSIVGIDEDKGDVYLEANKDAVLERQLYAVPIAGGALRRVTTERGVHLVTSNAAATAFVDVHSASDRAPKAVVRSARGAVVGDLPVKVDADLDALGIRAPELVTVEVERGVELRGALLKPRRMEEGKRYPAVVMVYGGPGIQMVQDRWSPRLSWQHLADRGFVVFQLDNRGSTGRGHAFETPIFKHLGRVELADQLVGLAWLKKLPFVDGDRVGIYGHSYGGYMAALAMLRAPGSFQLGIAGSPVTDWRLYDTGYTERYMETPASNAEGYADSDLSPLAKGLTGDLFVLHALMDENVHFANTANLVDALVAADKPFDLFVFPGERHGYRSPAARVYASHRVVDYLVEHLGAPKDR